MLHIYIYDISRLRVNMSAAVVVVLSQTCTGLMLTLLLSGHISRLVKACWILHHLRNLNYSMYKRSLVCSRHSILCKYFKSYEISEQTISAVIQDTTFSILGLGGGADHILNSESFSCARPGPSQFTV